MTLTAPRVHMTGYATGDRYYATRYTQGERIVYSIDLSLANITDTLPRPDPARVTPGNRRVKESHAREFGNYVRQHPEWVSPALILRSPDLFEFQPLSDVEPVPGTQFGILTVPRLSRKELGILDRQHRILGLFTAMEDITTELTEQRDHFATARRGGDAELQRHYQQKVGELEEQLRRFDRERISIQIHIEDERRRFEQMFEDIAENALGITSAIKVRFDNRKVVNRALESVLQHALLKDRVDMEQDRVGGPSPFILGAKHVADIVRTANLGIAARVGRRLEDELLEGALAERTNAFFDALIYAFPPLDDVTEGRLRPEELRKQSLLGSATMLRVLAGAYYELAPDFSEDEITDFFAKLAPHMSAPVSDGSPWLALGDGIFVAGSSAPNARAQTLRTLSKEITAWAKLPPAWMAAA